jgi:multiple sugar transport system substrate-binding protein
MNLALFLTDSRKLIWILGGAIGIMMFVAFIFILGGGGGGTATQEASLTVWGVFDSREAFDEAIGEFQKANKGITVTYRQFTYPEYEPALLNALAAGEGPDVFMIHNTWLPEHIKKIRPLPTQFPGSKVPLLSLPQFRTTFVDVAEDDLVVEGTVYGLPLYMDTLALFYNRDMLSSAGIANPPRTWEEFQADVQAITQYDESQNITRSGAAMGTAKNINRSTDILMMLMLQSGVQMTNEDVTAATFSRSVGGTPVGEIALQMYTDFANPKKAGVKIYSWNLRKNYNIDAFAAGETAMLINYSHQIDAIRKLNPRLNFSVAPVPQPKADDARNYANYWALTVALQSKHPYEAWQFAHFMTAGAGNIPYLNATVRPAARRDLIEQQKNDPDLNVFAVQALTARSWFQIDSAAVETIFADMIDAVSLSEMTVKDALRQAEAKVTVLMSGSD